MSSEWMGIPAAPGLARGPALHWDSPLLQIPKSAPSDLVAEITRLRDARVLAARQLRELARQVSSRVGEAEGTLFEAQAMFLEDTVLIGKAENAIASGVNAERAWYEACEYFASQLDAMPDETLRARSADVRDVGRRVVEVLTGVQASPLLKQPAVILARDLAPSQTAQLDKSRVLAFCTVEGGSTSHTAILARALGIPAIVGLGDTILGIHDGVTLLVDGNQGRLASDPTQDRLTEFDRLVLAEQEERLQAQSLAGLPAITRDGKRVEIVANVGSIDDARMALKFGAEGIGLLRTEFLFLRRAQPPDEQTQYAAYRTIMDLMEDRPIVVRTLDIGGDKDVPYFDFGIEANPFLGYRAIRISLDHPDAFKAQLRALLRAGLGHDIRLMFPMIASLDEVIQAKSLLSEARAELISSGIEFAGQVQTGIMVEIPSVILLAETFARHVDFFSIGTNDLTQYTLAAERGNKRVAHLNDPCHPAILRAIQQTVFAAHRAGIWVGVCGEMAGDLQAVPILLGLGVDELSVSPAQIPAVKRVIRDRSLQQMQELTYTVLGLHSAVEIRRTISEFEAG